MSRFPLFLAAFLLTASPHGAGAQDFDAIQSHNVLNDLARAHREQAERQRTIDLIERDQARSADSARQNAERDSRPMRRSDK